MPHMTLPELTSDQLRYARGIALIRWLRCLVKSEGSPIGAWSLFEECDPRWSTFAVKAAVNPGTTSEPAWGGPMAQFQPPSQQAVCELIRGADVLGQLKGVRRVPFQTSGVGQISGGSFSWVGEGAPAPVSNLQLTSANVGISKTAGIVIMSRELLMASNGTAERTSLGDLIRGTAEFTDRQLLDPTVTATSVSPASILAAAPSIASAGTSSANALTDAKALQRTFFTNNADASAGHWIMSPANAGALAVALNVPELKTLFDLPVVKSTSASTRVAIVDAGQLLVADDDSLQVDVSRQASVELNTAPTSPASASSVYVNLWQAGLVGIRVVRTISWKLAKPTAAVYTNASYV
jgi:hypothetical protein